MTTSIAYKPNGPTYAISVAATQTTAIAVPTDATDGYTQYALFYNSGATEVCVVLARFAATPATPALVFPVAGAPTVPNSFILPKNMTQPIMMNTPAQGFCVSAIGSAAGPSIIYITPVSSI